MIPLGFEGWAEHVGGRGGGRERVWEIYSQKTGLAYGEQSWLTEHLDTHAQTQKHASISLDRSLSVLLVCSASWDNLIPPSVTFHTISQTAESPRLRSTLRYARLFQLLSGYFSFEVVDSLWTLCGGYGGEKRRVEAEELQTQCWVWCNDSAFSEPVQTLRCLSAHWCARRTDGRAGQERREERGLGCF